MNKRAQRAKYLLSDLISASVVWALFNLIRYREIAHYLGFDSLQSYLSYTRVWEGQVIVPFFWMVLYYFTGYYNKPFSKSRVSEFFTTFLSVLIGVTILFFVIVLDDLPNSFHIYYQLFFTLWGLQFFGTYIPRLIITNQGIKKIKDHEWESRVLIIGTGKRAGEIADNLFKLGYQIQGFISVSSKEPEVVTKNKIIGNLDELSQVILSQQINELIVALDLDIEDIYSGILNHLYQYQIPIKVYAEQFNYLPRVKSRSIYGMPLIDITDNQFSDAEKNIKYFMDKVIAGFLLIFLSPVFAYISWKIKRDASGPVFFKQERIGYSGVPFIMYKFRTMYPDAEKDHPMLSSVDDIRITPYGRFMRKYRLDELPQFWNVLKGDMSLVGPRPERKYFVDQIVKKAPYYYLLQRIRPGITSWGMVKYGYADTVDKMIKRLDYDMLYYGHMSLLTDIKILLLTIKTVATGKGI